MKVLVVPLAALLLLAAGCGGSDSDSSGGGEGTTTQATTALQLKGVPWVLASGLEVNGWENASPSATFDGGKVTGFGGCGDYHAAVTVTGDRVKIAKVATAGKGCPQPGAQVEKQYVTALGEVAKWSVDGSALVLSDAAGAELLRFSVANPARTWNVTGILQDGTMQSVIPGIPLTAVIAADGSIKGFAGCNDYTADATIDRGHGTIEISEPEAGDKDCPTTQLQDQETAYLEAIPTASRYVLSGRELALIRADGTRIVNLTRVS